jgi:hypothetical protein
MTGCLGIEKRLSCVQEQVKIKKVTGSPNDKKRVGSATIPLKPKEGLNGPPQHFLEGGVDGHFSLNLPQASHPGAAEGSAVHSTHLKISGKDN